MKNAVNAILKDLGERGYNMPPKPASGPHANWRAEIVRSARTILETDSGMAVDRRERVAKNIQKYELASQIADRSSTKTVAGPPPNYLKYPFYPRPILPG